MSRVLVAGGGGYLGTVLVKLLLENKHHVRVLDRCFFGKAPLESFKANPNFELIIGDVRWPSKEVFRDIDILIDVAGISNDPSALLNPELTFSVNRDGTVTLAKLAKKAGVKHVIFSSSCSVYGQGQKKLLDEKSATNPVSLYAKCKLMAEEGLLALADKNFAVTILRNSTLYGFSYRMRFDLLVNIMTARAFRENKIFIVGGGGQWRPLLHVHDAARAFLLVMNTPRKKVQKQIFNVGQEEQNNTVLGVAKMVAKVFPGVKSIEVPEDKDARSYHVSFKKIKKVLGFAPEYTIMDSIKSMKTNLEEKSLVFNGNDDELTVTTLRYVNMTKDNPMLDMERKGKVLRHVEFYKHNITEDDIRKVQETLYSFFITTGSVTRRFEEMLAGYLGAGRVIGTTSCTESLFLCLKALGVGPCDEVITTPMTFVATANAIEHTGAKPVFVDVEPDTGNIDADKIEAAITRKTKAIMPVHLYGHMCDMKKISGIAKKHSLHVIEDAAHCVEGVRDGVKPGQMSDAVCFSFYATKNITCAEGGAIATNNEKLAGLITKLRLHGLSSGAESRYVGIYKHYDMELLGYKANMTNVSASLLLGQLSRIEGLLEKKEALAKKYKKLLSGIKGLKMPEVLPKTKHARHLFTVWVPGESRDRIIFKLQERDIGVAVNYRPVHGMKYYAEKYGYKRGLFKNAEKIGDETISLPFYPKLSDDEVLYVSNTLKEIMHENN